ncbi:hypothetical protein HPB52_003535 [Rhipicephalus sanguineus]|uniref:CCHC-type domain-containing protein n=1 Tax=Rhipicephalus sanguineus TaxID=34632 RepID=A0A9D4QD11_RHISA|nr:hypothetical protein HPB52_003535 [Rhipicephalus sanguineus]
MTVSKNKGKSKCRTQPATPQLPEQPAVNASGTETAPQSQCKKEVPRSANRTKLLNHKPPILLSRISFWDSFIQVVSTESDRAWRSRLRYRRGIIKVRVNRRRNIVAADVPSRKCLEELLGVTELCGIPVCARVPADRRYSTGYLHGVEGDPADDELLQCIESNVPVVSAVWNGNTVTLRFAGPAPSKHVCLFKLRCRVRPARPRPLQWLQCGRLGHVAASCRRANHCLRCGPPASAAICTYAQAGYSAPRPGPTPVHQQVGACSVLPSPASKSSPVTPAVTLSAEPVLTLRDDPRDAMIASLQLTLRAFSELLPSESSLKVIFLQAGGLQNTSSHHG